ncbi:hypothetical protein M404DRAFT_996375 [Pisolithus tinctorius Marx 270]|uniref:Uncharacterized protein n=1 Tax=Pisolithus tinctorius Marx 270 TaxID=870435 RepID=A0A0C3JK51_PISTI|nr:hypothetical protein M404DRAFT_996375 [Pisolithus tinctorius Marx 270]
MKRYDIAITQLGTPRNELLDGPTRINTTTPANRAEDTQGVRTRSEEMLTNCNSHRVLVT